MANYYDMTPKEYIHKYMESCLLPCEVEVWGYEDGVSVKFEDAAHGLIIWVDVKPTDDRSDFELDWNQFIFNTDNSIDVWRHAFMFCEGISENEWEWVADHVIFGAENYAVDRGYYAFDEHDTIVFDANGHAADKIG